MDNPTEEEILSFKVIQKAFANPIFLVHFSPMRKLYIDLDISKKWGFAAIVYYVKDDIIYKDVIPRTSVQPILFLSKLLNTAEANYWPTKLETAGIVWVVKKIRHIIDSTICPPVVIFTNHSASVGISRQTSLSTSNSDKLNLRLVRASIYLSQFTLDIRYKAGQTNTVPDALSRLPGDQKVNMLEPGVLDTLHLNVVPYIYNAILIEMSDDFKTKLKKAYTEDKHWTKVIKLLKRQSSVQAEEPDNKPDPTNIPAEYGRYKIKFRLEDDLLYYIADKKRRLCIPSSMDGEIFIIAYNLAGYSGFHKTYNRCMSLYIRHLSKRLREFINKCPECQLLQIKRYAPYSELNPIVTPSIPFHTIAIDFIVSLPDNNPSKFDSLATITCKFSKRILLLPGKTTWIAVEWANVVIVGLTDNK